MQVVANNKHVLFSYTVFDDDSGEVLDQIDTPLAYVHGAQQRLLEKVEKAMAGPGRAISLKYG